MESLLKWSLSDYSDAKLSSLVMWEAWLPSASLLLWVMFVIGCQKSPVTKFSNIFQDFTKSVAVCLVPLAWSTNILKYYAEYYVWTLLPRGMKMKWRWFRLMCPTISVTRAGRRDWSSLGLSLSAFFLQEFLANVVTEDASWFFCDYTRKVQWLP